MDLEELHAFLHVVEAGSFFAASESLCVSRTTLRRRVAALEARVGVPLLKSSRQGVVLTEAGQVLAGRGRIMMQETRALLASIREVGQEPSGLLRTVLPVGLPPHVLTPLVGMLRANYPRLHVDVRLSNDPLSEDLRDVDVALHFGEDAPPGQWNSYVILRLREWLLASRDYLQRRGTPRSLEELKRHELLAWQPPGDALALAISWTPATSPSSFHCSC